MARMRTQQNRRIVLASPIDFGNTTEMSSDRLLAHFLEGLRGWSVGRITVRVRYSRGADFSGTCFYADKRIFVNVGRHVKYPYRMDTNIARARTCGSVWRRPLYSIELKDDYQLALFVFMHELFHLLVKRAGRNTHQKEAMCDRFASRHLVDRFHAPVRRDTGERAPREEWDFQDLERFVAAARDQSLPPIRAARRALNPRRWLQKQLLLFRL